MSLYHNIVVSLPPKLECKPYRLGDTVGVSDSYHFDVLFIKDDLKGRRRWILAQSEMEKRGGILFFRLTLPISHFPLMIPLKKVAIA